MESAAPKGPSKERDLAVAHKAQGLTEQGKAAAAGNWLDAQLRQCSADDGGHLTPEESALVRLHRALPREDLLDC